MINSRSCEVGGNLKLWLGFPKRTNECDFEQGVGFPTNKEGVKSLEEDYGYNINISIPNGFKKL